MGNCLWASWGVCPFGGLVFICQMPLGIFPVEAAHCGFQMNPKPERARSLVLLNSHGRYNDFPPRPRFKESGFLSAFSIEKLSCSLLPLRAQLLDAPGFMATPSLNSYPCMMGKARKVPILPKLATKSLKGMCGVLAHGTLETSNASLF